MEQNLISAALSADDAALINSSLTAIKEKLPFLLTLTPKERMELIKTGNSFKPFLDKAIEVVNQHPEIFSPLFDQQEFKKDYDLFKALEPIVTQFRSITISLEDTLMGVGSDSLISALEVYSSVQGAIEKRPGIKPIAEDMKAFFPRKRKPPKADNPPQTPES